MYHCLSNCSLPLTIFNRFCSKHVVAAVWLTNPLIKCPATRFHILSDDETAADMKTPFTKSNRVTKFKYHGSTFKNSPISKFNTLDW